MRINSIAFKQITCKTMTQLNLYSDSSNQLLSSTTDIAEITKTLNNIDVIFERWEANALLAPDADQDSVLAAYDSSIQTLNQRFNFKSIDVVGMHPEHPDKDVFRDKFLHEHTHADFEVRFFVAGQGLFYIRKNQQVFGVLCTAGDLISVPPNTAHWFDMGDQPSFQAIRLFTDPEGWVADFTGDAIANNYPKLS